MSRSPIAIAVLLVALTAGCGGATVSLESAATTAASPGSTAAASTVPGTVPSTAVATTASPADPGTTAPPPALQPPPFAGRELSSVRDTLFSAAGACAVCHQEMEAAGRDVSIDAAWRSTMMANAARDPYWAATVRREVTLAPDLAGVIEGKCSTCHMPMARTTAVFDGSAAAVLGTGFAHPEHPLGDLASDGVSCSLCHQIQPDGFGSPASFSGGFVIDSATPQGDRIIFGPYDVPTGQAQTMASISGFIPERGGHLQDSELCATCHTLFTPTLDTAGDIVGEFAEQTPYLEWLASEFAATTSCQDCHLPEVDGSVRLSTTGGPPRAPFSQHHFVGGNTFMLSLFRAAGESLGVTASSDHFDATLSRVEDQLRGVTGTIEIVDAAADSSRMQVTVTVGNLAGHKFPTGYPSRRAWIHLTVLDGGGAVVFDSGAPQPTGAIAGNTNDADGTTFEPHYESISNPDEVQIYETVIGNTHGEVTTTLLRGAGYLKDNRLLPGGFDRRIASPDILPAGNAGTDPDFLGGTDTITYEIDLTGATGPFSIEAELLFQAIGFRWLDDLLVTEGPEVDRLAGLVSGVPNVPVRISGDLAVVDGS